MFNIKHDNKFYIDCYFDYLEFDLERQILDREATRNDFTEIELLELCYLMIIANSFLQ